MNIRDAKTLIQNIAQSVMHEFGFIIHGDNFFFLRLGDNISHKVSFPVRVHGPYAYVAVSGVISVDFFKDVFKTVFDSESAIDIPVAINMINVAESKSLIEFKFNEHTDIDLLENYILKYVAILDDEVFSIFDTRESIINYFENNNCPEYVIAGPVRCCALRVLAMCERGRSRDAIDLLNTVVEENPQVAQKYATAFSRLIQYCINQ